MGFQTDFQNKKIETRGVWFKSSFQVIVWWFVEISREKILKTFLKIPLNTEMNSNIF